MFLVLRILARSGSATIRISSAPISARRVHRRPLMRNVQHDAGRRHAQRIEDRVEGVRAEVVDPIERRRRRQQAETIGAFRQQAFHVGGIEPIGREHRVGNALHRILIVVEAGGAEGEVEIDDDGIQREIARDRPGHVVCDGGRADPALGADDRDHPADRDRLGSREQAADRAHHIEGLDRPDDVVVDAAPHQLAIGRDIAGSCRSRRRGCRDRRRSRVHRGRQ